MRRALAASVLAAMVCAGCVTTPSTFLTDVKVSPEPEPSVYTVEFRISEVNEDGTTDLWGAPRITLRSGQEAQINVGPDSEQEEISCKALVKENDKSIEAVTSVIVKEKGKHRWSSAQSISVLGGD